MTVEKRPIPVLYDGWPLVYQPNSHAALHLWSLLQSPPQGFQPVAALPGYAPEWLPGSPLQTMFETVENTPWGRLRWEQRILPRLCRQAQAELVHTCTGYGPLLVDVPVISSLAEEHPVSTSGRTAFAERLRSSLGAGGLARLGAILQPDDLPRRTGRNTKPIPPFSLPELTELADRARAFGHPERLNLGESFVLYHGPGDLPGMQRLLSAWSWVTAALGEQVPLVLLGQAHLHTEHIPSLMLQYRIEGTVLPLPNLSPSVIAGLYQDCNALFHPAELTSWGEPVRSGLSCAKPVVAARTPRTEALAGPAAYLAPLDDSRLLGAALLSVLVDEKLAEQLSEAARNRAHAWLGNKPEQILEMVYQEALPKARDFSRLTPNS